jgi:thiol-disulfide isomerase/thioredoxin
MKSYLRHIPFLIVLAIVSLIMTRSDHKPGESKRPKAGEWVALTPVLPTPAGAMLLDSKGGRASLSDYKGEVVLLNLWATWCTPCLKELPTLAALDATYRGRGGVRVITLSLDTIPYTQIEGFLSKKHQIKLPHLTQDDTGKIAGNLVIQGLPVTYLINQQGEMTHRFIGATDWTSEAARAPIDAAIAH